MGGELRASRARRLAVAAIQSSHFEVLSHDGAFRSGTRSSVVHPANPDNDPLELGDDRDLLFVVPTSQRRLLSLVANDLDPNLDDFFLTHGLASAVRVCEPGKATSELEQLKAETRGWEIWQVRNGVVWWEAITWQAPPEASEWPDIGPLRMLEVDFDAVGLPADPIEIGLQLTELQANFVEFNDNARRYRPDLAPTVEWVHKELQQRLTHIDEVLAGPRTLTATARLHQDVTALLDTNAALILSGSQSFGVRLPILEAPYILPDHSLLGVGSSALAVSSVYAHIHKVFEEANILERCRANFPHAAGFNPYVNRYSVDYASWSGHSVDRHDATAPRKARHHLVYFSSRWGFHETLNTISIGWECVASATTKSWPLLTLSHEFLHAHVREILSHFLHFEDEAQLEEFCERMDRELNPVSGEKPTSWTMSESVRLSLFGVLRDIRAAETAEGVEEALSPTEARQLVRDHVPLIGEVIVHILDLHYFYADDLDHYCESLWRSWALVPKVASDVDHYVLRTIAAIASKELSDSGNDTFRSAHSTATRILRSLQAQSKTPVISAAADYLSNADNEPILLRKYYSLHHLVQLVMKVFYSKSIHKNLIKDRWSNESDPKVGDEPSRGRRYNLTYPNYPSERIESAIGFLNWNYRQYYPETPHEEIEYRSLWQTVALADPHK